MGQKNIIELNGKKYDASTGAFLGESRIAATPAKRAALVQHQGRTIDGFIRSKQQTTVQTLSTPKPAPMVPKAGTSKKMDVARPSKNLAARPIERPKTLMRHVVSKPKVTKKPAIKMTAPAEMMAKPMATLVKPLEKKLSVTQVDPVRLARSKRVAKSHHIQRFTKPAELKRPQARTLITATARPTAHSNRPAYSARQIATMPTTVAQQSAQTAAKNTTDIFEAALAHATSHEQRTPLHTRRHTMRRKRLINAFAGLGAFLLIGGFIGYLNLTNIEMRVASVRAGFHAQMPDYKPSGFALDGGIESKEGRVAMSFRSGDSIYTVTQEASDWNSSTLLDQTASEQGEPTQTIQSKGRTIYIYDDSNATWVNGGVRYQVTGNAALDADELVALATSM